MSYSVNGLGSYYAMQGFGEYVPVSGLGGATFDPASVYSAWLQQTTAAANQAVATIQKGLNDLGYGPVGVDGAWGPASAGAFKKFLSANGLLAIPDCPGPSGAAGSCPTKDGIAKMSQLLGGSSHAGMGMMLGLGLAGAAVVAGMVLMSKKKHHARA
jgi:peptidoglycan hydrolase-like protein with peptidoglycan-binding domain